MGVSVAAVLLLGGCATERWVKPGATPMDYDATRSRCEAKAYAVLPPLMEQVQNSPGRFMPRETRCNGDGPNRRCTTTGGNWVPASYSSVDRNRPGRDQAVRACLFENGWTPVQD